MPRNKALKHGLSYLFLIVTTSVLVYPLFTMVLAAFSTFDRLSAFPLLPIPNNLNLDVIAFFWANGLWQAYVFTLGRCLFYIALGLLVGLLGGYCFSKLRFPGRNKLFLFFLSGLVLPQIVLLVPMYLMMVWFPLQGGNNILGQGGHGLINNWRSLFVFGWVSAFAIFIFKQHYDMLPNEYQDAAKMDGAGVGTIICRVYGPLLRPTMAALIVITFLGMWNDYLWPSLLITDPPQFMPITLLIAGTGISPATGTMIPDPFVFMAVLLALWPPVVVYFIFQRYLVQGLVATGLRG